ncbi:MAG: lipid II flippase MurJ [Nannocystaceae bacterium]
MPDALRSSVPVSLAILGSRVLGLGREVVFAALFGAGAIADAYQVAFRIPNLLRDLFAEGAAVVGVRADLHRGAAARWP